METHRRFGVPVSRRVFLGSLAVAAAAGLAPGTAAASTDAALPVESQSGPRELPESPFSGPASATLVVPQRGAVAYPYPWRSWVQLRADQALKSISHPQVHWVEPPAGCLHVPWVSQYDATAFANSNCGCASLSMLLAYAGVLALPAAIRDDVNRFMHNSNVETGASWDSLSAVADKRGCVQQGLYSAPKRLHAWSFADLDAELVKENPVLILVRFGLLPGRDPASTVDHYCVVVGRDRFARYYLNDPAYHDTSGAFVRITRTQLTQAWSQTLCGLRYTGMTVQPKS